MFAQDGTLLATASQSCILRYWRAEPAAIGVDTPATAARRRWRPGARTAETMPVTLPVRPGHDRAAAGPAAHPPRRLAELADLGYTDIWSAEADGADAFTPLALAAAWEPRLRLGTAIVPAYTRSPACFAQCVATLADAAPGRFAIGIGSSSNVIVERWNGVPFVEPYRKVRDVVRFLRDALGGEKVAATTTRSRSRASGSASGPSRRPPILVAALREGMLRLAGREADGAIINWLSPTT